jgi:hypothetical protein
MIMLYKAEVFFTNITFIMLLDFSTLSTLESEVETRDEVIQSHNLFISFIRNYITDDIDV